MNYLHSDFPIIFVFLLSHTSLDWSLETGGTWNHSYYYSQRERDGHSLPFPNYSRTGAHKTQFTFKCPPWVCLCNYLTTCDQIPTTTVRERESHFLPFPKYGHSWSRSLKTQLAFVSTMGVCLCKNPTQLYDSSVQIA